MTDNELIALFRPIIINGLIARGLNNVVVRQANQPTTQATETGPVVTFWKLMDVDYGFSGSKNKYNVDDKEMVLTEDQNVWTTFQIQALKTQNPSVIGLTASDLLKVVARILRSQSTRLILRAAGVGILRVTTIQNIPFKDDRGQIEFNPMFDFVLTHHETETSVINSTNKFIPGFRGI